jgi:hypothetical protein
MLEDAELSKEDLKFVKDLKSKGKEETENLQP